jgi:hypothetical protein
MIIKAVWMQAGTSRPEDRPTWRRRTRLALPKRMITDLDGIFIQD